MRFVNFNVAIVALGLAFSACTQDATNLQTPSEAVSAAIQKDKLELVDYKYARSKLGSGMRWNTDALFIDARPDKKYNAGTIPSSIQIHDGDFDEQVSRIANVAKDKEIIVFCQGWDCVKSANTAAKLKKAGYSNVKLYQAGFPDWEKYDYIEVGTEVIKKAFDTNSALLIDARPYAKFLLETIPGAISITDSEIDKLSGRFPANKETRIITFCQGYDCKKSHVVAQKLIQLGYKNVSNYSAGMEGWKKAGFKTTKSSDKANVQEPVTKLSKPFFGPIKKGLDEGTVDPQWFLQNYNKLPNNVKIVDVRKSDERKNGFISGSSHVSIEENDINTFVSKLPKTYVIFYCSAGGRSLEAWQKSKKAGFDKAVYFDAVVKCNGNKCDLKPNDALEPSDW